MSKSKYSWGQKALGWSNVQAAEFFDVNVTTIRRWINDTIRAPKVVIICLESLVLKKPVKNPYHKVKANDH